MFQLILRLKKNKVSYLVRPWQLEWAATRWILLSPSSRSIKSVRVNMIKIKDVTPYEQWWSSDVMWRLTSPVWTHLSHKHFLITTGKSYISTVQKLQLYMSVTWQRDGKKMLLFDWLFSSVNQRFISYGEFPHLFLFPYQQADCKQIWDWLAYFRVKLWLRYISGSSRLNMKINTERLNNSLKLKPVIQLQQ